MSGDCFIVAGWGDARRPDVAAPVFLPDPDQGRLAGPPCAFLVISNELPSLKHLPSLRHNVHAWRVESRCIIEGPPSPVTQFSFVGRADAVTHEEFAGHWTEVHGPLARKHHVGLRAYTQHVVLEAFTELELDGIAELGFGTRSDWGERFYDSDAGKQAIRADVATFIGSSGISATLMRRASP